MCDTVAGELIMSFHHDDIAARYLLELIQNPQVSQRWDIEWVENLADRLARAQLATPEDLDFEFHLLRVPSESEEWKINYLQFEYKQALFNALDRGWMNHHTHGHVLNIPHYHPQIVQHAYLWVNSGGMPSDSVSLNSTHDAYKSILGWNTAYSTAAGKCIAIVDTGVDDVAKYNIVARRNFIDDTKLMDVTDDRIHGTIIAKIIRDLCPSADIIIYKVAGKDGKAKEWDTLAALVACGKANVINMSLSFGMDEKQCSYCGRLSRSSRCAVFENLVDQIAAVKSDAIVVAAAGNKTLTELSYPARFRNTVAVESIDSTGALSAFTNRSTVDQNKTKHPNVFVAPGGQQDAKKNVTEYMAVSSSGKKHCGTSFSAAYVTGIITALWSEPNWSSSDNKAILNYLRANADKGLVNYDPDIHGNGMMRLL